MNSGMLPLQIGSGFVLTVIVLVGVAVILLNLLGSVLPAFKFQHIDSSSVRWRYTLGQVVLGVFLAVVPMIALVIGIPQVLRALGPEQRFTMFLGFVLSVGLKAAVSFLLSPKIVQLALL